MSAPCSSAAPVHDSQNEVVELPAWLARQLLACLADRSPFVRHQVELYGNDELLQLPYQATVGVGVCPSDRERLAINSHLRSG